MLKLAREAMSYHDPFETISEVRSVWRIHTPSRRYKNKVLAAFEKLMQLPKTSFYKHSFPRYDGYQFDLLSFSIDHGEESLSSSYPDW